MIEEKKATGQLSADELKEVRGGIPYEKPGLFEISGAATSCSVGIHCDSGENQGQHCHTGATCSTGTHSGGSGGPNTDPSQQ